MAHYNASHGYGRVACYFDPQACLVQMYSRSISAWNVRSLLKEWFLCDIGMLQIFHAFTTLHSIAFRRMSLYFCSKLKSDPEPTLQARTSAYPNVGIWLILIVDREKSWMIFDSFDAFDTIWQMCAVRRSWGSEFYNFLSSEFDGTNVPFDQFYFAIKSIQHRERVIINSVSDLAS